MNITYISKYKKLKIIKIKKENKSKWKYENKKT
jgi:hypothetical protein